MELDNNTSPVSDEQRRLAETKKLTLEPVHSDVTPDDTPDAEVVGRHLSGPAPQNAPNDMEQSSQTVMPAPSATTPVKQISKSTSASAKIVAGLIVTACFAVTLTILFLAK